MKKLNNLLFIIFGFIIFIKLFTIQKKRKLNKTYEKYENNVSNLGNNLEGINTTLQGISNKIDFLTGFKQIVGGTNDLDISVDDNNKNNYYAKDTKFVKEEDDDNNEDYNEPSNESENINNNKKNPVDEVKYKRINLNITNPLESTMNCINLKNSSKYNINKLNKKQLEELNKCD
jgi:hypothetical protein